MNTATRCRPPFLVVHRRLMLPFIAISLTLVGCAGPDAKLSDSPKSEVVVMGMIHSGHLTSKLYGIDRIKQIVRRIDPDYILCEIPPDRFDQAIGEFRTSGTVSESRVRRFPEYVQAIFPLSHEMHFTIVPCAGWTQAMSDDRQEKLKAWEKTRPEETQIVNEAEEAMDRQIKTEDMEDDPAKIHTARYDALTKKGLEPYNRLFNDDLGPGGWGNINTAHYALITRALGEHRGEGKRFLITFGAGHKYWFLEKLRRRRDIVVRSLQDFLTDQTLNTPMNHK